MAKRPLVKLLVILLVMLLMSNTLAGCGNKDNGNETPTKDVSQNEDKKEDVGESKEDPQGTDQSSKVTDKPITITYWSALAADKVAPVFKSLGDTKLYQELEKRTGVHVEFLHPPVGQETEQFNLLVASGEYPDVIERDFNGYPGGPEKAIKDGVIIKLNELFEKNAPNLMKLFNSNQELDRLNKTDEGTYYTFPFIRGHEAIMVFYGPIVRQDWLEELNLKAPETIDEWYNTLKTVKENKKDSIPFTFRTAELTNGHIFVGAFGVAKDFYLEGEEVKYGPMEPGYKDFLATFRQWYAEGLIDPDFASQDAKTLESKIAGEKAFAFQGYAGGIIGKFLNLMKDQNPNFNLAGVPNPSLEKGGRSFGQRDWSGYPLVSITTANKHPEETVRWLDYGYGEEGELLFNFGLEGESYVMEDGYPKYTDIITNNPNGLPMSEAMSDYMRSHYNGPMVQRKEYFDQFMQFEQQIKAVEQWAKGDPSYRMPRVSLTAEEAEKNSAIMNEINTYVDEMLIKFIMGQEPLDKYDEYVENLKKMGIEEAMEIRRAALQRYFNR